MMELSHRRKQQQQQQQEWRRPLAKMLRVSDGNQTAPSSVANICTLASGLAMNESCCIINNKLKTQSDSVEVNRQQESRLAGDKHQSIVSATLRSKAGKDDTLCRSSLSTEWAWVQKSINRSNEQYQQSSDIFLRGKEDDHNGYQLQHQHHHHPSPPPPAHHHNHNHHHHQQQHNLDLPSLLATTPAAAAAAASQRAISSLPTTTTTKTNTMLSLRRKTRRPHRLSRWPLKQLYFNNNLKMSQSVFVLIHSISVIISLILHVASNRALAMAAPESQATHNQSQRDISMLHVAGWPLSSEQHYTNGDFSSFTNGDRSVAEDDRLTFEQLVATLLGRHQSINRSRRHLAVADWDGEPQHKRNEGVETAAIDCQKLAVIWVFLQSSYPALASHLFQWASQPAGHQGAGQFRWAQSSTSARALSRVLEEAERLMVAQGSGGARHHSQATEATAATGQTGWLQRVNSNPAYARLVQHLRANKLPKSHTSSSTTTTTTSPPPPPPLHTEQQADEFDRLRDLDGESMMVSPSQQQQQQHFGRVINYPHEIGDTTDSNGMTRTISKLRRLKVNADPDLAEIESNRIPSVLRESDAQKPADSESVDSARNNFVYGRILLRPEQLSEQERERTNPLGTLRELADERQRQLMMESGGKMATNSRSSHANQQQHQSGGYKQHHSTGFSSSSSDNYGRIITSPPSAGSNNHNAMRTDNEGRHLHQFDHNHLRHQEDGGANFATNPMIDSGSTFNAGSSPSADGDELSNQQRAQQVAFAGEQAGDDEFEGEFHSAPLKEIEVRQLRSLDQPNQASRIRAFDQVPQVELITTKQPNQTTTTTTKTSSG